MLLEYLWTIFLVVTILVFAGMVQIHNEYSKHKEEERRYFDDET